MLKRKIESVLRDWKAKPSRKPLVIKGVRQCGKTFSVRQFAGENYIHVVYIDFFEQPEAKVAFQSSKKVDDIVMNITAIVPGATFIPGQTCLILDELQECPEARTALKFFKTDGRYDVICTGSLLGVSGYGSKDKKKDKAKGTSVPVGYETIVEMNSLDFEEFLWAKGCNLLAEILNNCEWDSLRVHDYMLQDLLRQYYYVGGMPEVVLNWVTTENVLEVRGIQNRIIASYANDISKHAGGESERIRMVWQSIPSQLAKENKKFIYGAIKKGARTKDFEVAIQWLVDAGLVYKTYRCKTPEIPLKFYVDFDAFKLYALDIGLLGAMVNAPASLMLTSNDVFKEFKGAFSENYVLQQLVFDDRISICYFTKENSQVEVDFFVQTPERLIPVEVKAEENVKSKSLRQFITIDHAAKNLKGLRCSMLPYQDQGWMENIPLYGIFGYIKKLLQ